MIDPSDPDYVETKSVKQGKRALTPLFRDLANWISVRYPGVSVLNIYYDELIDPPLPRLSVIFEWEREAELFRDVDGNFNAVKQAAIAAKFAALVNDHRERSFNTNGLLVVFTAFEPVARLNAIWSISAEQLVQWQRNLNDPTIWKIREVGSGVGIFFYTDAQLKNLGEDLKAKWSNAYAEMISAHDDFGYFRREPAQVIFDSKENFEREYQGNWFNYDRR